MVSESGAASKCITISGQVRELYTYQLCSTKHCLPEEVVYASLIVMLPWSLIAFL